MKENRKGIMTLGARLRQLRDASGATGDDVCRACGIDRGTLSRYENDNVNTPNFEIIKRLARLYGVSLDELGELTKGKT